MNKIIKKAVRLMKGAACALALAAFVMAECTPVLAGVSVEYSTEEGTHLFPDKIILTDVSFLGEEGLPANSYGRLEFTDPDAAVSEGEIGAEVRLIPGDGQDLSWASGYDPEENVVKRQVRVIIVSSGEDENIEASETNEVMEAEAADNEAPAAAADTDASEGENTQAVQDSAEENEAASETSQNTETANEQNVENDSDQNAESPSEGTENESLVDVESFDAAMQAASAAIAEASLAAAEGQIQDAAGQPREVQEQPAVTQEQTAVPQDQAAFLPGQTDSDPEQESAASGSDSVVEVPAEEQKTIFDSDTEEDTRSTEYGEDLTEEQKLEAAAANHTSNGIFVTGTNLPWYVQFTAESEDFREYASAGTATIFASFRFELKDLSTGADYEIPDGEYVSVTVPVKEGYDYTVEHVLDNGGVELITPSVTGNILSFSTHSFSSFGIAGSRPVVDSLEEDASGFAPSPAPTSTPIPSSQGSGNGGTPYSGTSSGNGTSGIPYSSNSGSGTAVSGTSNNSGASQTAVGTVATDQTVTNYTGSDHFNVPTGDDTPILPLVGIVAAALVVIILIIILKSKRK